MIVVQSGRFGWRPSDLGAALKVWLDADDASTFAYSSGSIVSQWNDKSGNALHATQGTVAQQPARTGTMNGRLTVAFDGSNDMMTIATPNLGQPYWMWIVFTTKATVTTDADIIGQNTPVVEMRPKWGGGGVLTFAGNAVGRTPSLSTSTAYCWGALFSGASSQDRQNGVASATFNAGTSGLTDTGGLVLSRAGDAATYLASDIAEVVVTSTLSAGDITSLESYFTAKWGKP